MTTFKTKEEYQQWYAENKETIVAERKAELKKHWENLPHFNTPEDIPNIPVVPKDEYNDYYVPKLIAAGAIPKDQLVDGQVYIGDHRNCTIAKWDATDNEFKYWRHKFKYVFIDTCKHFQDDDGFALFVPIGLATEEEFQAGK